MEENGVHFQVDISNTDIRVLKNENFIRIEKERVERIDRPEFPPLINDISRLTFFHPGDLDTSEKSDTLLSKDDLEEPNQESNDILSVSSVQELADVFVEAPLETAPAFQDPLPVFGDNGNISLNTTAFHLQENVMNLSFTSNSSFSEWSPEEIGAVFIVCLMVPFIIISNLFVIVSVVRFRRLHTPTNYFITSLAAVDIVVALATPLTIAMQLFQYGGGDAAHDTILCLLPNRILMMACGVSLLTLATIAYDRHTALISPLEYVNIMTSRKVGIMMTLSWLYSSAVTWFPIAAGWYDVISPSTRCSSDHLHPKVHILFFAAIFIPSCTVILICYSRIFLVARHHAKAIAAVEFAVHRRLQVRFMIKDTKYAKTLALVIGGFLLLWLPHLIYTFIKTFGEISTDIWLETYLVLLAVFNSGINPWIYAFKNNEFRAAFKRMAKEYCSERFCKIDDRRSSLVSGISITPRLSRTDSRMVSTILEPAVDSHGHEKLRRSLDSLDEYEIEVEQKGCKFSEANVKNAKSTSTCDILPTLNIVKEVPALNNSSEGHINWAHTNDEQKPSPEDIDKSHLFRKNSGTPVSRNQSFTMGFNHICTNREHYEKDLSEQICTCKHSSQPVTGHKLSRSISSVTPSSILPYSIIRKSGEPITPFSLNLRTSRLSSPPPPSSASSSTSTPSPSDSSETNNKHPFASPYGSTSPSSAKRDLSTHKTRPRPSRSFKFTCHQVHHQHQHQQHASQRGPAACAACSKIPPPAPGSGDSNSLVDNNNTKNSSNGHHQHHQVHVSKVLVANHERHVTDINNICTTNACHCSTSSTITTTTCLPQAHSCPTFAQTQTQPRSSPTTNFHQTSDRPQQDVVCLPRGQPSTLGVPPQLS